MTVSTTSTLLSCATLFHRLVEAAQLVYAKRIDIYDPSPAVSAAIRELVRAAFTNDSQLLPVTDMNIHSSLASLRARWDACMSILPAVIDAAHALGYTQRFSHLLLVLDSENQAVSDDAPLREMTAMTLDGLLQPWSTYLFAHAAAMDEADQLKPASTARRSNSEPRGSQSKSKTQHTDRLQAALQSIARNIQKYTAMTGKPLKKFFTKDRKKSYRKAEKLFAASKVKATVVPVSVAVTNAAVHSAIPVHSPSTLPTTHHLSFSVDNPIADDDIADNVARHGFTQSRAASTLMPVITTTTTPTPTLMSTTTTPIPDPDPTPGGVSIPTPAVETSMVSARKRRNMYLVIVAACVAVLAILAAIIGIVAYNNKRRQGHRQGNEHTVPFYAAPMAPAPESFHMATPFDSTRAHFLATPFVAHTADNYAVCSTVHGASEPMAAPPTYVVAAAPRPLSTSSGSVARGSSAYRANLRPWARHAPG